MSSNEIEAQQLRIVALRGALDAEEDMVRYLELTQELERAGKRLGDMVAALTAGVEPPRARIIAEVVLTDEQRATVLAETGVSMASVLVDDTTGGVNATMPVTNPATITTIALRLAGQEKVRAQHRADARAALVGYLRELEGTPGLAPGDLDRLRTSLLA